MKFVIIGKVQPKQRPRFSRGHTYTPKQTVDYERHVRQSFMDSNQTMLYGAIKAHIKIFMIVPKSASKSQQLQMLSDQIRPTKRPDLDNSVKAILDALNVLAYKDDSQIVELIVSKHYGVTDYATVELENVNSYQS